MDKMAHIDSTEKHSSIDHIEAPASDDTSSGVYKTTMYHQTIDDAIIEQLENGELVGFTWKTALACLVRPRGSTQTWNFKANRT